MPRHLLYLFLILSVTLRSQNGADLKPYEKYNHTEIELLGNNINSDQPDLSPFRYADKLYFSTRVGTDGQEPPNARIVTATADGTIHLFEKSPRQESLHMGDPCLTVEGNRMYYTLYRTNTRSEIIKSEIWYRDKDYFGNWGPPVRLPRVFTKLDFQVSQPATGIMRDKRQEVLFFVSDRPGGKGKLDIWYSMIDRNGNFSEPVNLPTNTPEDDMSPFFDTRTQTLFFSSKGMDNYGGFDVFRTKRSPQDEWMKPENLGRPVNSNYDDIYFHLHEKSKTAYFSSDRPNETCPEAQAYCRDFDIYKADLRHNLQVYLFEDAGNTPLSGCNVELKNLHTQSIETTYLSIQGNYATLGLKPDQNYQLIISKQGFYPVFLTLNTEKLDLFKPVREQVFMKPMNVYGNK